MLGSLSGTRRFPPVCPSHRRVSAVVQGGEGRGEISRYFLGGFSGPARESRASRPASSGCLPPVLAFPGCHTLFAAVLGPISPPSPRSRSRELFFFFFFPLSRRGSDFLSRLPAARVTQADLTGAELPEAFKRREHFCLKATGAGQRGYFLSRKYSSTGSLTAMI